MKLILVLTGLGVLVLLAEIFRFKKILFPLVLLGILGSIATAASYWWYEDGSMMAYFSGMVDENHKIPETLEPGTYYARMLDFNLLSTVFSVIILSTAFLWFLMSKGFFANESSDADHYALVIFTLVGAIILTCYSNLAMLFLGVEILSIPLYVLAGSRKDSLNSNESAFKYFLMGAFASSFLLFGIALVYGATGSFDLGHISMAVYEGTGSASTLLFAGVALMLVGLLFKVSAAPFHFWAPDVYQGAPTYITAFMSTIVKTAAIVAVIRLFSADVHSPFGTIHEFWIPILAGSAALTIFIGNISAAVQSSVKRTLAYSSISHAGFLLLAIVAFTPSTGSSLVYYTAAYSFASIAAFTVLINILEQVKSDGFDAFNGLGKKSPFMAFAMTVSILSLAGIPPTSGFFGKYFVLSNAMSSGHIWLVILAILGSLVGVYYYFRIIIAMYFKSANNDQTIQLSGLHKIVLLITTLITIALGVMPDCLLFIGDAMSGITH